MSDCSSQRASTKKFGVVCGFEVRNTGSRPRCPRLCCAFGRDRSRHGYCYSKMGEFLARNFHSVLLRYKFKVSLGHPRTSSFLNWERVRSGK